MKPNAWRLVAGLRIAGIGLSAPGLTTLSWLGAMSGIAIVTSWAGPSSAATLSNWIFDADRQALTLTVPTGTTPRYFIAAEPARIVVDLPNTDVGTVPIEQTYEGAVRRIRIAQFQPGLTRIVLELAPGTVLAPGQVELQSLETDPSASPSGASEQWMVRPLLADAGGSSEPAPSPAVEAPIAEATPLPSALPSAIPDGLPPLEPGAVEIPIESIPDPANSPASVPSAASEPSSDPSPAIADQPAEPADPDRLPAAAAVPTTASPATVIAPAIEPTTASEPVAVAPTLTAPPTASSASAAESSVTPTTPIPFGAPLPESAFVNLPTIAPGEAEASLPFTPAPISLPSGTILSLRYPGSDPLQLSLDQSRQEVLILEKAVEDADGNVLIPAGSQVIGRFETRADGSMFIAQAVTLQGRNQLLQAQSAAIDGERQVGNGNLFRNSALGAAAGIVLGSITGIGLIPAIAAGAATSAATTYVTAPQPAVIHPDQVLEVQLTEDLTLSSL